MVNFMAQLKAIAAAVLAALAGVAYTTVTDPDSAINPDAPAGASAAIQLPNTTTEWVTLLLSVLVSYLGVYLAKNRESVPALETKLVQARARVDTGQQSQ